MLRARAVGAHVDRATPARLCRVVPRMRLNSPPTKSVVPEGDRDRLCTAPTTPPSRPTTAVPPALRVPSPLRGEPLRVVKEPPTKRVPSARRTRARTSPSVAPGAAAGSTAPVVRSRRARRGWAEPPTVPKAPPTQRPDPSTRSVRTVPSAPPDQGRRAPVAVATLASSGTAAPPIVGNAPPTKRASPSGARARAWTGPSGAGAQAATDPSASTWATFERLTPPTTSKSPARYQPPAPSATTALTMPSTDGNPPSKAPVTALATPALPVWRGPTRRKLPATYTRLPICAVARTSPSPNCGRARGVGSMGAADAGAATPREVAARRVASAATSARVARRVGSGCRRGG